MKVLSILFAVTFSVQPLVHEDGPLELSIQHEVDHAISMGERWLKKNGTNGVSVVSGDLFLTNGLTRQQKALKFVTTQRAGGYWSVTNLIVEKKGDKVVTNQVPHAVSTKLAIDILKGL